MDQSELVDPAPDGPGALGGHAEHDRTVLDEDNVEAFSQARECLAADPALIAVPLLDQTAPTANRCLLWDLAPVGRRRYSYHLLHRRLAAQSARGLRRNTGLAAPFRVLARCCGGTDGQRHSALAAGRSYPDHYPSGASLALSGLGGSPW